MLLANPRLLNLLVFLGCAALLAFGLYLEHVEGWRRARCAWCSASSSSPSA